MDSQILCWRSNKATIVGCRLKKKVVVYYNRLVLVWIGIAVGILLAIILIVKVVKTPSHEAVTMSVYCKKCGYKTNGLKCPKCDKRSTFR